MRRAALICLNLLAAATGSAAFAQPLDASRQCRLELTDSGIAACLASLADERDARMEARIAETLAGLQAARAGELRTIGIRYGEAQAAWRAAVRQGCAGLDDPADAAACRLEATVEREAEVEESLARAAADLGGAKDPGVYIADEVEVFVPLELPGPAGGLIADLPILIPLLP